MAKVSCRHEADSSWDDHVTDVITKREVGIVFYSFTQGMGSVGQHGVTNYCSDIFHHKRTKIFSLFFVFARLYAQLRLGGIQKKFH